MDVRVHGIGDPVHEADGDKLFAKRGRHGAAGVADPRKH